MSSGTAPIQLLPWENATKADFEWGDLAWYANRGLGNSSELTVGRCRLKPGQGNPRHYHPNCSEVLVVMQGTIVHTGPGGDDVPMKAGDTVTIPPNVWHCARNTGQDDALLFIAFSSADRETAGE